MQSTNEELTQTKQTLYNESITDFLIVEYQDRIGGRMREVNFGTRPDGGQYVVEAGANWVLPCLVDVFL